MGDGRNRVAEMEAEADWRRSECETLRAEIERLRANIERLTANPADYRYWEGRYRDEAADNERLRAALHRIEDDYYVTGGMARKIARAALEGKDG